MNAAKKILVLFAALFLIAMVTEGALAGDSEKININTASAEELAKLDKIGLKYAQNIIEYRQKNGPFKQPEDIMNVKGIGQKLYEINKEKIVVEKSGKTGKAATGS
ncbi:MAG: ComEA family DNA-binding protein [Thermodesulfobacteriota bacterium]